MQMLAIIAKPISTSPFACKMPFAVVVKPPTHESDYGTRYAFPANSADHVFGF